MRRRSLLRLLPGTALAACFLGDNSIFCDKAFALGGELPDLNSPAPPFSLQGVAPPPEGHGDPISKGLSLADFQGRWLVLYFYPKDFTPGCTLEARGFQRDLQAFHQRQAEVVGISTDPLDSHGSFCGAEGLAYPLLSDPDGRVSRLYGSWLAPMALRHTFLIDPEGTLRARWVAVRPLAHSQEVLQTLAEFQATS